MITTKMIESHLKEEKMINIVGESGTGKTTLALQYLGKSLPKNYNSFWIQANEKFPRKRFRSIFNSKKKVINKLKEIILVPGNSVINNLNHQEQILHEITHNNPIEPKRIHQIVIDNISHQLRKEILDLEDIQEITNTINNFFNNQLLPLISFCFINNIQLIMIHECTYNPENDRIEPFSYKLFSRIKSLWIELESKPFFSEKICTLTSKSIKKQFNYLIDTYGIVFY